jgi:hypothetical protein
MIPRRGNDKHGKPDCPYSTVTILTSHFSPPRLQKASGALCGRHARLRFREILHKARGPLSCVRHEVTGPSEAARRPRQGPTKLTEETLINQKIDLEPREWMVPFS